MIHTISIVAPRGNIISVKAAGTGPTLMLLHGFPLDHRMWLKQLDELSSSYHVLVPEMRGFGKSTGADSAYTLKELADDIEFVRSHLADGQPIRLCGLSMGGYVALEYWKHYRHHLKQLILANTKPTCDDEAARTGRLEMADRALVDGGWAAVEGMFSKLVGSTTRTTQPEITSRVEAMMQSTAPQAIATAQRAMAGRRDFTNELPLIDVPTLVITGSEDEIAPPDVTKDWAGRIPNSKYFCVPSSGHLTPMEQPVRFNELLRLAFSH